MNLIQIEGTTEVPHLLLNRPKRVNALSASLLSELVAAINTVVNSGARSIVLAGNGRGFSGGADLSELSGTIDDLAVDERIATATDAIVSAPIPVVVALHGFCFGGAVDLAWSSDLVIATPNARIALPAARLGILYNPQALQRLHARLGTRTMRRLLLFGEELNGQEAFRIGAVDQLAAPDQLRQAANSAAQRAAKGVPPAVAASKAFLNALDANQIALDTWETRRRQLLASKERQTALGGHPKRDKPS
ncbi:MAG: enoyl-CoA hydratase/isomerase family protein [Ardenticatenaceae bacterium]